MERIDFSLSKLPSKKTNLTLALGGFDGFHLGHMALAREAALFSDGPSGILFFAKPFKQGKVLSDLEDKVRFAFSSGLDYAYCLHNEESFFGLSASSFLDLLSLLGVSRLVCGEDYSFGKGKEGDARMLKERFAVEVVPFVKDKKGEKIGTHRIKTLLEQGDIKEANELLGRHYETKGEVVHGLNNGRRIGFPTVNLSCSTPYLLPSNGVYAGLVYLSGIPYKAMMNVGDNPTVGQLKESQQEAYLFGYEGDAYGKRAYFQYLYRIREEKKFASLQELKKQLLRDESEVLAYFSSLH